jgi:thioredoxin-dependent peroxiredoxin
MSFPKIGNKAPAFALKNQQGEKVSLKDFSGKKNVVLYFYPKASTPGCTVQACGIRDIQKELTDRDTVVFGISPDPSDKLQKFIDKQGLNFDLLSDEDHTLAEKYGVWGLKKFMGKEFMGILRTTFIINKESKLVAILDNFKTNNHDEILIAALDTHIYPQ